MPGKFFIRADGGKNLGMGHINRINIIANYLFDKFELDSVLITREDYATEKFLSGRHFPGKVFTLTSEVSDKDEAEFIQRMLSDQQCSFIILDILEEYVTREYLDKLRQSGLVVCVITDSSYYQSFNSELIVNGNPNQDEFSYFGELGTYMTGPDYFLMGPEYAHYDADVKSADFDVLLTLGGSDHNNLIFTLLQILENAHEVESMIIITSKATGYYEELVKVVKKIPLKVELLSDIPSLAPYWSKAGLAITAGGNTLFERIASSTPGATLCQLTRQQEIAEKFEEMGVNYNLGYGPEISETRLADRLFDFLDDHDNHHQQKEKARSVVDGRGLERFSEYVANYL